MHEYREADECQELPVRRYTEKRFFDNYFEINAHSKNTRGNNTLLKLPKVKTEFERKGFYFFGAKLYNDPPRDVRKQSNYFSFKDSLLRILNFVNNLFKPFLIYYFYS